MEVLLTVVPRSDGEAVLHTVWRDITERRQLEARLRQSQRMEAVGSLAGGIAHDFNNLLVAVIGYAEQLGARVEADEDQAAVEQILRAAERATGLVRQRMAFSRKQEVAVQVVDLGLALEDLRRLLGRVIGEHIELRLELPPSPVRVAIDPSQLEQVVVNLATNARDAMPEGGAMTVRVTPARDVPAGLSDAEYVRIEVRDQGHGMDAETARRAFDPFFTTKAPGKGTGLGLATVYGIVQQAGGLVRHHSHPTGTTVEVFLPTSAEPPTHAAPPPRREALGGSETILLVEDEEAVSSLLVRVLTRAGYRVVVAGDGLEALEAWERTPAGSIDLVLTDVVMPRMGGAQLVRALRERGLRPAVLFMSGYTADRLDGMAGEEVDLLRKPFTAPLLLERVRAALARASAV